MSPLQRSQNVGELTNELVPVVIEEMIELGRVGEEWRVQREQL